jgi:type I restriction enzyme S subunit
MDGSNSGELFSGLKGILASTMGIIKFDHEILNSRYLIHFLSVYRDEFTKARTGSAIPHLNKIQFDNLEIPILSISEQKRIVKILDETFEKLDKLKENTEKNLQNSKELFESYLNNIFSNPEKDWEEKLLKDVCLVERGSSPRPIQKYITNSEDGVNWIKIGDTKNVNKYLFKINQKITKKGAEKSRFVKDGDLILSNSMSFGKPYIMKTTGYIHDGWFVLRPMHELDTEYFYNIISSPSVQKQINLLANGAVVKNISGDLVKKVTLSIPPIKKQKEIVKKINQLFKKIKKVEEIYKKKIENIEELKKSILHKAFNGEL